MKKLYYLSSCSTCLRIMKEIGVDQSWELIDIKRTPIAEKVIDEIKKQTGSYEQFFSKRAVKYKSMNLKDKSLTEKEYKKLLLEEYTFLQRPLVQIDDKYYIGNSKATVTEILQVLEK
jgi:arsenate reductase (glutaredoxin)